MMPPSHDTRLDQPGVSWKRASRAQSVGGPSGSPVAGFNRTTYQVTPDRYSSSVDESHNGSAAPSASCCCWAPGGNVDKISWLESDPCQARRFPSGETSPNNASGSSV